MVTIVNYVSLSSEARGHLISCPKRLTVLKRLSYVIVKRCFTPTGEVFKVLITIDSLNSRI